MHYRDYPDWLSEACLESLFSSLFLSLSLRNLNRKRKRATTCCAVNNIERGNAMDLSIATRDSYVFMSRRNLVEWDARALRAFVRADARVRERVRESRTQQVSISALEWREGARSGCAVLKNERDCDARIVFSDSIVHLTDTLSSAASYNFPIARVRS